MFFNKGYKKINCPYLVQIRPITKIPASNSRKEMEETVRRLQIKQNLEQMEEEEERRICLLMAVNGRLTGHGPGNSQTHRQKPRQALRAELLIKFSAFLSCFLKKLSLLSTISIGWNLSFVFSQGGKEQLEMYTIQNETETLSLLELFSLNSKATTVKVSTSHISVAKYV